MSPAQFRNLPALIARRDLLLVGFTDKVLLALRHVVDGTSAAVPPGKIGCLRVSRVMYKYRRSDAARLLGPEWL